MVILVSTKKLCAAKQSGALSRMLVNITIICVVFVSVQCVLTRVRCDANLFRSLTGILLLLVYDFHIYSRVRIGSQLEYFLLYWMLHELQNKAHAIATNEIDCSLERRNFNFSLVTRLAIHIRNVPVVCEITSKCIYQSDCIHPVFTKSNGIKFFCTSLANMSFEPIYWDR